MAETVRFQILGPMRIHVGDREVSIKSIRDRMLLAVLLLSVGEPVPTSRLADAIWGQCPPADARNQLHGCVSRLRRQLANAGGSRAVIVTDPVGYRLAADPGAIDLYEFRRLRNEARRAAVEGDRPAAIRQYRVALALWRGPVLAEFESDLLRQITTGLDEERIRVLEECLEIELDEGQADELIPELTELVREHPYREKLHGALMLALYRAGRQADALAAYRDIRQLLLDELGTEPADNLQDLHRKILNRDASLYAPRPERQPPVLQMDFQPAVPRTLPPDITDFVGREKELAVGLDVLTRGEGRGAPVVVITGPAGVGKTALATRLGYELRSAYQDGQIYVNLHGFDADAPVEPYEVLGRFLRALGVDGAAMPSTLDERAELYRNLLADRAVLVVLDNAASDDQLLPLLPGDETCGVVITSRLRLGSSFGADTIHLDVLEATAAADMVSSIAGTDRTAAEPEAVSELARLCGRLPLAVRIAAGRLATKPHWTVERLVQQLRDERKRLDQLTHGTLDVRVSISMSYRTLGAAARCLLRRLGHMDLPEASSWISAALLDTSVAAAEETLEQLFDAQLIEAARVGAQGTRYRLHDLVRIFAREQATHGESSESLGQARSRTLGACLFLTTAAYRVMYGGDHHNIVGSASRWKVDGRLTATWVDDPLSWFDVERSTITTMIHLAAEHGHVGACWELASTATPFYQTGRHYDDWQEVLDAALNATRGAGDRRGEGATLHQLGWLHTDYTEYGRAKEHLTRSAALFRQVKDDHGWAVAVASLGMVERYTERDDDALQRFQAALPILRDVNDRWTEAFVIRSIGQVHLKRGDFVTAERCLELALRINRSIGSLQGQAQAMFWHGMLCQRQGRYGEAEAMFHEALEIAVRVKDRAGQAQCLRGIGLCHQARGDHARAKHSLLQALNLIRQPRNTHLQTAMRRILATLGEGR